MLWTRWVGPKEPLLSAAHQPGAERWRDQLFQRQGLPRSANVGHEFFEHLGPLLAIADPTPADLAVLQVHALVVVIVAQVARLCQREGLKAAVVLALHGLQYAC